MEVQKQYRWLLIVCLIALLIPYLYISRYANPVADDWVYAHAGKNNALADLLVRDYYNWNGRYFSNILVFSNPMVYPSLAFYKLAPFLLIILTVVSYFFLITSIVGNQVADSTQVILALVLSILFLYQMPIISEGFYWYTGAVTYELANVTMVVYLGCLRYYTQGKIILKSRLLHLGLITMLLIASIGFNETHMITLLLFSFLSLGMIHRNQLNHAPLFLYLLIVTLIFSAIVFFAPGNEGRASLAANNHRLGYSLVCSLAQTVRFFLEWTSSIPLILLSFLYYYLNKNLSEKRSLFSHSFYLSPLFSCGLLFGVIFIGVFPPYWATGILGQHRTLNVSYYLFLLVWFMNLTVFFNLYKNELGTIKPIPVKFSGWLLLFVLFSFSFTKNGYHVVMDIFYGKARLYDQQMKKRVELMKYPTDTIYFQPLADPPKTLFVSDIMEDPGNWLNQAYTLYFECQNSALVKK